MREYLPGFVLAAASLAVSQPVQAQTSLGTFRWQLQPFCNVVTVTVVQQGSQYHVDGTDDLCGASRQAAVVGRAFPNPDGTIGFGLTTVTTTGAAPIHLDARIVLATLSGAWTDSAGNSGTFAYIFTPVGTGGAVRPVPAGGIAPGTITSAQLAPGSVTAAQLAPGAVNAAVAAFGTCPAGQYLRGLLANGNLLCEPVAAPPASYRPDSATGGAHSSIAIGSDGLPIISHTNGALRVTHCRDLACTTATSTSVDTAAGVGSYSSIVIGTDGLPVISHYDRTNHDLRVTHCNNVACTSATSTSVDTAGDVGSYSSIAVGTDGLPIISHWDATNGDLRVTHCSDVMCLGATSTSVDTANTAGLYSSIAIGSDGLPVVSHASGAFVFPPGLFVGVLRVTHCSDRACTAATSTSITAPGNVSGDQSSIAIGLDGWPIISSFDNSAGSALRVTHCGNALCTAATSTIVDSENLVGQFPSISIGSDGLPIISHYDGTNGDLRVTHCSDVACASATSVNVDAAGDVGRSTSIAIGTNGLPVISHHDVSNGVVRVTSCGSRTCR